MEKHHTKNILGSNPVASTEWPGYIKNDSKFFALKVGEIAHAFSQGPHVKSQRVSKMLGTLSEAMIEDGYRYFLIHESISRIWPGLSRDWNENFVQAGGQLKSGQMIQKEVDAEMAEKLGVYPAEAYNLLQHSIQGLRVIHQLGVIPGLEADRMHLVLVFVEVVHQSTLMDHWFDRIESAILNPMPSSALN
jgi:hypothetical protein